MGRRTKCTPEAMAIVTKYIRAGAYDWVAAQAVGIEPATFWNWMRWGEQRRKPVYITFFEEVNKARSEARLTAEAEVKRDNPLAWLRYGPGRERKGQPGWTETSEQKLNVTAEVNLNDARSTLARLVNRYAADGTTLDDTQQTDE